MCIDRAAMSPIPVCIHLDHSEWEPIVRAIRAGFTSVMIDASHNCVQCRGVGHQGTSMKTSKLTGEFIKSNKTRNEFYEFVKQ